MRLLFDPAIKKIGHNIKNIQKTMLTLGVEPEGWVFDTALAAYLLDATAGCPHVGFCWDTGHEQCYNRGTDMMRGRAHRLIATHFNDNLGVRGGGVTSKDDLHFLPFDGITDWQSVAERLKQTTIPEYLIFEVKKREKYADLTPKEFIGEAYRRAHRFAAML